jgi:hypothetical protein
MSAVRAAAMSWKFVAESRWKRRRKRLPGLKLKYPNDDEVRELAELAQVGAANVVAFGGCIRSIILDAHLDDLSFRELSTPKIRNHLESLSDQARKLASSLEAVDLGSTGSAERAGLLLEIELSKREVNGRTILLPECISVLEALSEAAGAKALSLKSNRRKEGTGGNPAFDRLIENLFTAAWQLRGDWTNYRSDRGWTGTLLQALTTLRKYLPQGIFPGGELGRSVEHARSKFKKYITKNARR